MTHHAHEKPPQAVITELAFGRLVCQALYVAAELGLADLMKDGPRSAAELAAAASATEDGVYRVLRALAAFGVFEELPERRFRLNGAGELLRSDVPGSFRGMARLFGHDVTWRPTGQMMHSVKTGEPAFDHVHRMKNFEYISHKPDVAEVFNEAMTSFSTMESAAVVQAYDFTGISTLMDVGGGHGYLIASVLQANPSLRGMLFELPHAVEGAQKLLSASGLTARCAVHTGDFFEGVPAGADACIMKHIIHDWNDAQSLQILRSCHRALPSGGRLLVVETVVPAAGTNEPHLSKLLDLEMLVMTPGGRERSEAEYRAMFEEAGFRFRRVVPTQSPASVVEGVKP